MIPSRPLQLPGYAIVPIDPADAAARLDELRRWIEEFTEWRTWADKWLNKTEAGLFNARDRRPRPEPPVWLEETCRGVFGGTGTLITGCRLLTDFTEDAATAIVRREIDTTQTQQEAPTASLWWQHVHFDALWPTTTNTESGLGLFGVHATIDLVDRVQVFVAPGAMLLRVPSPRGGNEFRAAPVWGFSYRLSDFKLPGVKRSGVLHANIVRAWVMAGDGFSGATTVNLVGFSLTFK